MPVTRGEVVRHLMRIGLCVATVMACGCTGSPRRERYKYEGTVMFSGKPVPLGYVIFSPDAEAGNSGPSSQADIIDGRYSTPSGEGLIGGAYVLSIFGYDRPNPAAEIPIPIGSALFDKFTINIDVPRKSGRIDVVVPSTKKHSNRVGR